MTINHTDTNTDLRAPAAPLPSPWLTTKQAAEYVGLSDRTLEDYRTRGGGPEYVRPAGNLVRYHRARLDAWMEASTVRSTAEEARRRTPS